MVFAVVEQELIGHRAESLIFYGNLVVPDSRDIACEVSVNIGMNLC